MNKKSEPIIIEQIFDAPAESIWTAITQIDQMHHWYFDNIPSFEPEVGFETQFTVESQGGKFHHLWKVTEVVPFKKITYNWKYEGYAGDSFVTFELYRKDYSTVLRLTHNIIESFPQNIPEFSRESGVQGWTYFIKKSLKDFIEREY